jgi:hypothetical protein
MDIKKLTGRILGHLFIYLCIFAFAYIAVSRMERRAKFFFSENTLHTIFIIFVIIACPLASIFLEREVKKKEREKQDDNLKRDKGEENA